MIGKKHINDYRDGKALTRFLESKVGQPWNKVYSEICAFADHRSNKGRNILRRLEWIIYDSVQMINNEPYVVHRNGNQYHIHGLYIHPETGILCFAADKPHKKKVQPIEKVYWIQDIWFKLETFQRPAKCGCVYFKVRPPIGIVPENRWRRYHDGPEVCIHGNEAKQEKIWYVVFYGEHSLDEIYKTHVAYSEYDLLKYNLKKIGDVKHIYYRDVPEIDRKYVVRKKQANHKELQALRGLLRTKY
jgi:hypothetical protein